MRRKKSGWKRKEKVWNGDFIVICVQFVCNNPSRKSQEQFFQQINTNPYFKLLHFSEPYVLLNFFPGYTANIAFSKNLQSYLEQWKLIPNSVILPLQSMMHEKECVCNRRESVQVWGVPGVVGKSRRKVWVWLPWSYQHLMTMATFGIALK